MDEWRIPNLEEMSEREARQFLTELAGHPLLHRAAAEPTGDLRLACREAGSLGKIARPEWGIIPYYPG